MKVGETLDEITCKYYYKALAVREGAIVVQKAALRWFEGRTLLLKMGTVAREPQWILIGIVFLSQAVSLL